MPDIDGDWTTPAQKAVYSQDYAAIESYLKEGVHPDKLLPPPNGATSTALVEALKSEDLRMADLLLRYGADVNQKDYGRTLLYRMAEKDRKKSYEWLLKHGEKPDSAAEKILYPWDWPK